MAKQAEILSLYREFLRNSKKFENYNFREYFLRRTRDEFKKNKDLTNPEEISKFITSAQKDLLLIKRQATISQMYHFDKLVVEKLDNKHHVESQK